MSYNFEETPVECAGNNLLWKDVGVIDRAPINPWNKTKSNNELTEASSCSFRDLMSEDMAKDLQQKEDKEFPISVHPETSISSVYEFENSGDTNSDFLLACMLQQTYNEEHDNQIKREEKHFNKYSKVSVSFSKYKVCPESFYESSDEDHQNLDDENRAIDKFEESKKTDPVIPPCGYIRHNNQMVTKHDQILSGRRNAERVMNFPPGLNTGDGGGFDMQLSNKVFNKLARTSKKETKRMQRMRDKVDKATTDKALDMNTKLIVFKLVNNNTLERVNEVVSTGKESVVFHARGGIFGEEELPEECAVKVFKTTLTEFKTREKYIRSDYRFKDRLSKNNNKMMIQLWAEKEFHNLRRLQKAKIPSPKPLLVRNHVLVMSFIGDEQVAAPKLKHTNLSHEQWGQAYEQVVDIMTTMFRVCKLVHGDMSEYNLLWYDNKCWVIDLGQAVEPVHPHAMKFFYRDCSNIVRFFKSKGLADVPSPLKLFELICGVRLPGGEEEADRLIEEYSTSREMWRLGKKDTETEDTFEFLWNEAQHVENIEYLQDDFSVKHEESEEINLIQEEVSKKTENGNNKKKKKSKKKKNQGMTIMVSDDGPILANSDGSEKPNGDFSYVATESSRKDFPSFSSCNNVKIDRERTNND